MIPLLVGFSLKHVLEKKMGTSLAEANSTPSGSSQATTNEEPNPSTSEADNEVNTYLLLTEFEIRTLDTDQVFSPSIYGPSKKRASRKS